MLRSVLQVLHLRPWGEYQVSLRNLGAVETSDFIHSLFTEVKFATAHRHNLLLQGLLHLHIWLLERFFGGVFKDVEALRCLVLVCSLTVAIRVIVETKPRIRLNQLEKEEKGLRQTLAYLLYTNATSRS